MQKAFPQEIIRLLEHRLWSDHFVPASPVIKYCEKSFCAELQMFFLLNSQPTESHCLQQSHYRLYDQVQLLLILYFAIAPALPIQSAQMHRLPDLNLAHPSAPAMNRI